jgi:hypothetical protein
VYFCDPNGHILELPLWGKNLLNKKETIIMAIQPIPEGYHTATPYLIVKGAGRAIEFY